MPLSLPYTYRETDDRLVVNVIPEGVVGKVEAGKVDVFCHGAYLKLFYPPHHVVHLDLHDAVEGDSLNVLVSQDLITLTVDKAPSARGEWPSLLCSSADRATLAARRAAFVDAAAEAAVEKAKAAKVAAARTSREAVAASVDVGRRKRELMAERKAAEEAAAMADVYSAAAAEAEAAAAAKVSQPSPVSRAQALAARKARQAAAEASLPPVRATTEIEVGFSERVAQEEAILKRSTTALADDDGAGGQANIADASAQWLKLKGDEFLLSADIPSALNAYDRAIEIDPNFALLFSNRAICQLRLSRFEACVSDASQALALAALHAPSAPRSPLVLIRRGTALLRLGQLDAAADDYVEAAAAVADPVVAADTAKLLWRLTSSYRDHAAACLGAGRADTAAASLDKAIGRARNPQEQVAVALGHIDMLDQATFSAETADMRAKYASVAPAAARPTLLSRGM
ncbi:uncharacterized protein AMSG_03373 [Thecamonas trahens ATCC 50062]|uniref:Uncharacterized protein n=1 Tax=Thecamonas trahens ATCC 50062 TaxID=461836 RepID=A0A0L0D3X3_THETB|nr:hypothetical protein AMSG_03373 [Thecamonas trahens ATCC 50062]KNC46940.1 hypothetical protein AMSG_03373 [Thecamonas trahens ATCC 50062]|eukprot:XP_013760212.1 hypothetical protein AMSG_03373 [Thecamonas trahens ATCC 50062]